MNVLDVQNKLISRNIVVFTPLEFQRVFGMPRKETLDFLWYHTKGGLFVRLKRNLYCLASEASAIPETLIANRLYQPSYISFEYALSYYHLIPETVYAITSATTKPTREFEALGKAYQYSKIKREAFLGYEPTKVQNITVLIAEPEKATVDYLYFVDLKKKNLNERLDISKLSRKKIQGYTKAFRRPSLSKLVEGLL